MCWALRGPREVRWLVAVLNTAIVKAGHRENVRVRLAQLGAAPITGTPEYFRKLLVEEIERWGKVVRATNAKPE